MQDTDSLNVVSSWQVSVLQDCSGAVFHFQIVRADAEDLDDPSASLPELQIGLTIEMLRHLQTTLSQLIPAMEAGMRPERH